MSEIDDIKASHFDDIKGRDAIFLVKGDYGWRVEQWFKDGVAPSSDYDTPQEAAARALQLLRITEPVTPQNWPEIAQIGGEKGLPPRHPYPGK